MSSEASPAAARQAAVNRRRRQLLFGFPIGTGLASALSACGGGPDDEATLRAINATVDVASIDVQFNDWLFAGAVAYGGASSAYARRRRWALGPFGSFEVRLARSSPILLQDTTTLPDGDTASIVVMGNRAAGLKLRVIDEDMARPGAATARLRLLHAWPLVGALDAFVTRADQTLSGQAPSHRLSGYEALSAHADVSGDGRLRITPAGKTDLVLFDSASIGLAGNQVATLVLAPMPDASRVAVAVLPQGLPAYRLANTAVASRPGEARHTSTLSSRAAEEAL